MHKGKINSTIKLLTNKMEKRMLPLNNNSNQIFKTKTFKTSWSMKIFYPFWGTWSNTVKPLNSGHLQVLKNLSVIRGIHYWEVILKILSHLWLNVLSAIHGLFDIWNVRYWDVSLYILHSVIASTLNLVKRQFRRQGEDWDHLKWELTVWDVYCYQIILGAHQKICVKW